MFEFIKLIWILLIFFSVSSCSNKKVDPCTQTKIIYSSIDIEYDAKICFKSIDSYDLNYENKPEITIYANLSFPKIKKETYE